MTECTGVKRHLLLSSFVSHAIPEICHKHISIRIIPQSRTWTYRLRMGSRCSLTWHRPLDHLFILFITSQRMVLCKSKSKTSMREPTVAVWSVGDAWNMSQMARICTGFVHAEYFSDKSRLRYDTTNKHSSHELSTLAPNRPQGYQSTFVLTLNQGRSMLFLKINLPVQCQPCSNKPVCDY